MRHFDPYRRIERLERERGAWRAGFAVAVFSNVMLACFIAGYLNG